MCSLRHILFITVGNVSFHHRCLLAPLEEKRREGGGTVKSSREGGRGRVPLFRIGILRGGRREEGAEGKLKEKKKSIRRARHMWIIHDSKLKEFHTCEDQYNSFTGFNLRPSS